MINRVLLDENKQYWFDFSKVESVWEIHDISNKITLSDVDFIAKTDKEILFIEYKNANIRDASKPNELYESLKSDRKMNQLVKKYYDSLLVFWAFHNKSELPIRYIFLVEGPLIDADFRRRIKLNLMNRLPFKLDNKDDTKKFISSLEVYDLEEFKNNIPNIVIKPVVEVEK
ncbi:hypothetical protein [Clostridium sp. JNZ J1-5]